VRDDDRGVALGDDARHVGIVDAGGVVDRRALPAAIAALATAGWKVSTETTAWRPCRARTTGSTRSSSSSTGIAGPARTSPADVDEIRPEVDGRPRRRDRGIQHERRAAVVERVGRAVDDGHHGDLSREVELARADAAHRAALGQRHAASPASASSGTPGSASSSRRDHPLRPDESLHGSFTSQTFTFMPATTRPSGEPEGDELTGGEVAPHDELGAGGELAVARVLHAEVVLVGEEVGDVVVRHRLAAIERPARAPPFSAFAQCSTRSQCARRGLNEFATSPAA
jgi:hypothetical protein